MKKLLQKQTLASFDFEWRLFEEHLNAGTSQTRDHWNQVVDIILAEQELCIGREWFPGRRVLDVGCGVGRWIEGFRKLGCVVDGLDASPSACRYLSSVYSGSPTVRVVRLNLFDLPGSSLWSERYDLVFAWGVLDHTGDTSEALRLISTLVRDDGLLYLFLYGKRAGSWKGNLFIRTSRLLLLPLPFRAKAWILRLFLRTPRAVRNAFDQYSPIINARFDYSRVIAWLQALGFNEIFRPYIDAGQIFVRASRSACSARPYFRPPPRHPYWWEGFQLSKLRRSEAIDFHLPIVRSDRSDGEARG
ncbi:MAG: class I SAM-dependent methyltransferase [Deltaproteobacteria bacterium]|nr:class I SAM-dependent methyltransferase [Deltaproteobacteria bacterium]